MATGNGSILDREEASCDAGLSSAPLSGPATFVVLALRFKWFRNFHWSVRVYAVGCGNGSSSAQVTNSLTMKEGTKSCAYE